MPGNFSKQIMVPWVPIWVIAWLVLNGLIWSVPFLSAEWAGWVRLFLSPVCHQLPEASCQLNGGLLPVCCRCTAMYLGFLTGTVVVWFAVNLPLLSPAWMTGAAILMGLDVGLNALQIKSPDLLLRAVTGGLFGLLTGMVIFQRLKREVRYV